MIFASTQTRPSMVTHEKPLVNPSFLPTLGVDNSLKVLHSTWVSWLYENPFYRTKMDIPVLSAEQSVHAHKVDEAIPGMLQDLVSCMSHENGLSIESNLSWKRSFFKMKEN